MTDITIAAVIIEPNTNYDISRLYDNTSDVVDMYIEHVPDGPITDFSKERNESFVKAFKAGATHAIMLDTDMEYSNIPIDFVSRIENMRCDYVNLFDITFTYAAPRIFRVPLQGKFVGLTHEYYDCPNCTGETWQSPQIEELAKTEDEVRDKRQRDIKLLRNMVENGDNNPRWAYYLGDSLHGIEDYKAAIPFFNICARTSSWAEEAAWSCYRAATCYIELLDYNTALEVCVYGLTKHSGIPELYWLAGWICYYLERYHDSIQWEKRAIDCINSMNTPDTLTLTGFRNPHALYEGPYDVLSHSYNALRFIDWSAHATEELLKMKHIREEKQGVL